MTGRLLTARTVADMLDVSTETVLRWTRRGDLEAIRLPGGAIRISESQLDEWLIARTTTAPAQGEGRNHANRRLHAHITETPT